MQDPVTIALISGSVAVGTVLLSRRLDSGAEERRTLRDNRRADDRAKAQELTDCEETNDTLRARIAELYADNAALRATLLARNIPLPPPTPSPGNP
jgi:hypothetical protein